MKYKLVRAALATLFPFIIGYSFAQQTVVKGRVKEALTGTPIPFANVIFRGTAIGTTTDFDGFYSLDSNNATDSIEVSYIGYVKRAKAISHGQSQTIDFQLEEDVVNLDGVTILSGENPAFPIMRKMVDNKKKNDKRSLEAYEYESYNKIEIDINNMSDRFTQRKLVQKVKSVLDSIEIIAGDDGEPILPIFISEAISNYYFKKKPRLQYENIIKTKISGIGIEDGSLTSQVIGSTFQEYNFYNNWVNALNKEFASPISNFWKANYEYDLVDSLYIDDLFVYRLEFWPKRDQDLAFRGTMWIAKDNYALRRIDATVEKSANLNFVRKLKIQQDLLPTESGAWIPEKSRVAVDIIGLGKDPTGLVAQFYTSFRDIKTNSPRPDSFYRHPIKLEEDAREWTDEYWNSNRHEPLSPTEITVSHMIDTLKTIPSIKTITDLVTILGSGYWDVGKLDLGPWWLLWANNDIEGIRLGFGARTNQNFSRNVVLKGDFAYGIRDQEFKYGAGIDFILSRKKWTVMGFEHRKEIDPVWAVSDGTLNSTAFRSFARFGDLETPFRHYTSTFKFQTTPSKGLITQIGFKQQNFTPLKQFSFFEQPGDNNSNFGTSFETSEVNFEIRYAKDELFIIDDNDRLSLGTIRSPRITLKYSVGLNDLLGSDFDYQRLALRFDKNVRMGGLGVSNLQIDGGYIFGQVPFPLLKTHIGNEFPVYYEFAFNQMNFFEFASDKYVELKYLHHFEGFILNRIPLMKKLKWRLVGIANFAWGSVRNENLEEINPLVTNADGVDELPFTTFDGSKPYVELGGGIENIFKFFFIGAVQRITYLDRPGISKTGLIFGLQFIL